MEQPVYVETQTPTTNANGLVSIEIGGGTVTYGDFTTIDWSTGTYYIKTETDPTGGTGYTITGTSQILSVPYALHAKTVASYPETDPVFIAHPANGITGTNITNWNTAYGWGNHSGLYRPISYVPAWGEITSNPFSITSPTTDQLLKYNGTNWVNVTSGFLTNEVDGSVTNEIQNLASVLTEGNDAENKAMVNVSLLGVGTASPEFSLTLDGDGGILATGTFNSGKSLVTTGEGTRLIWYPKKAAFRAGRVYDDKWDDGNIGLNSVGMGTSSKASGGTSTAMGSYTTASGEVSTAMGNVTMASGLISTAMGNGTTASGDFSTAMGNYTKASGSYSIAMGNGIEASGINSIAFALNDQTGTIVTQDNTMAIMGGNVGIGTVSPAEPLTVNGVIAATGGNSTDWNDAFSWGDHASAGYLTSFTEADPTVKAINGIVKSDGTTISSATAGTDYLTPTGSAASLTNFPTLNQNTTGNAATVTTNANLTGMVTSVGNATTVVTNANLTGQVTSVGNATTVTNEAVIGKILTGYVSGAGTVAATDNILQAIQKLNGNNPAHYIGESYGGGIVFYVYDNGRHGLIAATADQSTGVVWTNTAFQTTVSNVVRDGINGGLANTERIIIQAGAGSYAAQLCANYNGGNYADWYLPSKYELNLLYLQKTVVGGFANDGYWSSTESNNNGAWLQCFGNGDQSIDNKDDANYVRAVRAF